MRPVVGPKKNVITVHRVAGIILWNEKIFIQQRKADDVWGGLWEFPGGQVELGEAAEKIVNRILQDTGLSVALGKHITKVVHQYTHHKIILHCFLCTLVGEKAEPILASACNYRWISSEELEQFAFPAGPRKILEYIKTHPVF